MEPDSALCGGSVEGLARDLGNIHRRLLHRARLLQRIGSDFAVPQPSFVIGPGKKGVGIYEISLLIDQERSIHMQDGQACKVWEPIVSFRDFFEVYESQFAGLVVVPNTM